jgi:hypothetical protein
VCVSPSPLFPKEHRDFSGKQKQSKKKRIDLEGEEGSK